MRGAGIIARPNVAFYLTAPERTRDGERAARRGSTRGYAAHAVRTLRPAGLTGGAMVRRAYTQRSLVEVLLPDGDKLWDPILRRIDAILDDDDLIDRMAEALARRHPRSRCLGRAQHLIRGRRLRVDTTVVETNIHYPTDSTLLADGVRVLMRTVRQLGAPVRERSRDRK